MKIRKTYIVATPVVTAFVGMIRLVGIICLGAVFFGAMSWSRVGPPSTHRPASGRALLRFITSATSLIWYAMHSSAARTKWALRVFRFMPKIAARTLLLKYGALRPEKAGTRYTPLVSGTLAASGPASLGLSKRPMSSTSHLVTAPV